MRQRLLLLLMIVALSVAALPAGAAEVTSVASGRWDNASIWTTNRPPTSDDVVRIDHAVRIDEGVRAGAAQVDVAAGRLMMSGGELHLYGSLIVRGQLTGDRGQILFHVGDDRLFSGGEEPGPDPDNPELHPDDVGLWALRGSRVNLKGPTVTSWLDAVPKTMTGPADPSGERRLLRTVTLPADPYGGRRLPTIGDGTVTLAEAPKGWQPGDRLLLTSLHAGFALATLVDIADATIRYADVTVPNFAAFTLEIEGRQLRPKVANLSRPLVIASAGVRDGDTHHRAHTIFLRGAQVTLDSVELRDLGPRDKPGRNPVHFYRMGDATCVLQNSSIHQTVDAGNRFVAIEDTDNCRIIDNVAFRSMGHGYLMQGTARGGEIVGNLSVDVRQRDGSWLWTATGWLTSPEEIPIPEVAGQNLSYHFWLHADNVINRNVVVGERARSLDRLTEANLSRSGVAPAAGGLAIVANSDKSATKNGPNIVETEGQQIYNVSVGVALILPFGRHVDLVIAYSGSSFSADSPDQDAVTLENPTLAYNIEGQFSTSSAAKNMFIQGGLLVGPTLISTGFRPTFVITDATLIGTRLLDAWHFRLSGIVGGDRCKIRLVDGDDFGAHLFAPEFWQDAYLPGLFRLRCVDGSINGRLQPDVFNADYTDLSAQQVSSLAGIPAPFGTCDSPVPGQRCTVQPGGARRLSARMPLPTGFIRMPPPRDGVARTWRVVGVGERPIRHEDAESGWAYRQDETAWRQSLKTVHQGAAEGYPEGDYEIQLELRPRNPWIDWVDVPAATVEGAVITKSVHVRPGEVVDLPEIDILPVADVLITIRPDSLEATVGETVSYTVTLGNIGQLPAESLGVVVAFRDPGTSLKPDEPPPAGGQAFDFCESCEEWKHMVLWQELGRLAPGEGRTLTFKAVVTSTSSIALDVDATAVFCWDGRDACGERYERSAGGWARASAPSMAAQSSRASVAQERGVNDQGLIIRSDRRTREHDRDEPGMAVVGGPLLASPNGPPSEANEPERQASAANSGSAAAWWSGADPFVPGQVLIGLALDRQTSPAPVIADLETRYGLHRLDVAGLVSINTTLVLFDIVRPRPVPVVVSAVGGDPRVLFAQPNFLSSASALARAATAVHTDPLAALQFAPPMIGIPPVHGRVTGKGVRVAVIDTGVDTSHPDLAGRIVGWVNVGGGADVAEIHGTAVAGVIAAEADNGKGIYGVAPHAEVLAIRACRAQPASPAQGECTSHALAKALDLALRGGARVLNLSITGPREQILPRLVARAEELGVVVVAAAGNGGPTAPPPYPAALPTVIAVTAVDAHASVPPFANQGDFVSLAAPGVDVLTTIPGGQYRMHAGTSLAAAHVSGVVALLLEARPDLSPAEVRSLLTATATDLGLRGGDPRLRRGLVNACRALEHLSGEALGCE